MYYNRFSARIVGGVERDNGYVAMTHGKDYTLSLRNDRELPCDAEVRIDGKHVGTWRIETRRQIVLEHPIDDHGRFTFYLPETPEGQVAGLRKGDPDLGLISVRFVPGHTIGARPLTPTQPPPYILPWRHDEYWFRHPSWYTHSGGSTTCNTRSALVTEDWGGEPITASYACNATLAAAPSEFMRGGTGLSGYSGQHYGIAQPLLYLESEAVTINLRLVGIKEAAAVRPLQASSTPVPVPVG